MNELDKIIRVGDELRNTLERLQIAAEQGVITPDLVIGECVEARVAWDHHVQTVRPPRPHWWSRDGETCLMCGDRDWNADRHCSFGATAEQETWARSLIRWLEALPKYKKTDYLLGQRIGPDEMAHCCLGVACLTQELPNVTWQGVMDARLVRLFGREVPSIIGYSFKPINRDVVYGDPALVAINDRLFASEADHRKTRLVLLATLDGWIPDLVVSGIVRAYFSDELYRVPAELEAIGVTVEKHSESKE